VDRWAMETLDELLQEAATEDTSSSSSSSSTVELVHTVVLQRQHNGPTVSDFISDDYDSGRGGNSPLPAWTSDSRLDFQHLTVEMLSWQNQVFKLRIPSEKELVKLGYLHAWLFRAPITDSPRKLEVCHVDCILFFFFLNKTRCCCSLCFFVCFRVENAPAS
jgi:hypothetical protein